MAEVEEDNVLRIFPGPPAAVPLRGLYLSERFGPPSRPSKPFVYTNFIASLDGRTALPDPRTSRLRAPADIVNARDWRLFQELAAAADALVTTGRHVRALPNAVSARSFPVSGKPEYGDLLQWRRTRGLSPQPAIVIVSATLELPALGPLVESPRAVYVATGAKSEARKVARLESEGVRVLRVGEGARVEGGRLIEALAQEACGNIAMVGGGELLHALLADDVLDRLYLTLACRFLGGQAFETLVTGATLDHAAQFKLEALHYDSAGPDGTAVEQLFAVLGRGR